MAIIDWINAALGAPVERKTGTEVITTQVINLPPNRSSAEVRNDLAAGVGYGGLNAIQISAVFACARVISEGLAQIPCILQRRSSKGGHEAALDHPLYDLLARAPNSFMTSFELREWIGFQLALLGNAYVFVSRDNQGRAIELIPLPHGSVSMTNPAFGEVVYRLNVTGQPLYSNLNIWHLKGASWDGLSGMSPQMIAARAIGLASDLEAFGSQLFRNGSRPSGLLTTDQALSPEQMGDLSRAWNEQQAGIGNAHKTAVLANGLEFRSMQTTADDAQFIQARRYQIEEICRIMRVDPLMVQQATDSASYSSIEQRFLAHLTHTLAPWFARFEQSAEVNLLTRAEQKAGYRIHLDTRSLSRGSAKERADYHAVLLQNGIETLNEARDDFGLDRSDDPAADELRPAANLYGDTNRAPPTK